MILFIFLFRICDHLLNCSGTNTHWFFKRKKPAWSLSKDNVVCECAFVCAQVHKAETVRSYLQQRALEMWFTKASFSPEK